MLTLVGNSAWIAGMVLGLALAGGVAVRPFASFLRFAPLVQPLAGLLVVVLGTLALYVLLRLPLAQAGAIAWVACCVATVAGLDRARWRVRARGDSFAMIGTAVVTAAVATGVTTATSVHHDEPAFVYFDWTDHLGYAHMADWLNGHLVSQLPVLDSTRPYTSYPNLLVSVDPRFGSFTTLALVSQVIGRSGMFSYDLACALVLAITVLGLAGVFAQNRASVAMLVLGLLSCHWFDYNRTGFFAKAIAFPSAFLVAGLFTVVGTKRLTPATISMLALLASAAALMQSGASAALFLTVIGGTYLLAGCAYAVVERRARISISPGLSLSHQLSHIRDGGIILGLLIGTAVLSSGTLARPLSPTFPDWGHGWQVIFPRIADLEPQTLGANALNAWQVKLALLITACSWLMLAILAMVCRDRVATAVLLGPAALLIALRLADQRAMAFQMIGVFYPLALCGAATLVWNDRVFPVGLRGSPPKWLALSAMGIAILLHCPRFIKTAIRYGVDAPAERQFLQREMQGLVAAIGDEPVRVDVGYDLNLCIALLVELERQNIALQWAPDAWRAAVGYRPTWPVPQYSERATLRLVKRHAPVSAVEQTVYVTQQVRLVRTAPHREKPAARPSSKNIFTVSSE